MNISPLDLDRLAVRVETLERTRTHGWAPGDDLEFENGLHTGRDRRERKLPDPEYLRVLSQQLQTGHDLPPDFHQMWRYWIQTAMRLEGLKSQNDPRNPLRMMRDMARGKLPRRAKTGPGGVIHTKRDDHKWNKAKGIAEKAGKKDNYAYIMGIYKKMEPTHDFKTASAKRVAARALQAYGAVTLSFGGGANYEKALRVLDSIYDAPPMIITRMGGSVELQVAEDDPVLEEIYEALRRQRVTWLGPDGGSVGRRGAMTYIQSRWSAPPFMKFIPQGTGEWHIYDDDDKNGADEAANGLSWVMKTALFSVAHNVTPLNTDMVNAKALGGILNRMDKALGSRADFGAGDPEPGRVLRGRVKRYLETYLPRDEFPLTYRRLT